MNTYVIAVGSNLGDRAQLLRAAEEELRHAGIVISAKSAVRETEPVGGAADRPFLNAAWLCLSPDMPSVLLRKLQAIEAMLGRVREERWGNRTIDLDVLLWKRQGDTAEQATRRHEGEHPTIPHPRLLERPFALEPAAEVAPDWIHPYTGRSLREEVLLRQVIPSRPQGARGRSAARETFDR
jgi:2-amino-4-hydroxy-6-hydroxymethyldihydropteridine diphosphokinase